MCSVLALPRLDICSEYSVTSLVFEFVVGFPHTTDHQPPLGSLPRFALESESALGSVR